jgi:hypothetical protein
MVQKVGRNNEQRGFAFKLIHSDAGKRSVARFTCSECQDCLDIANSGTGKSAEWFVARCRRIGWAADARNRNKCYCPRCLNDWKGRKDMAPEKTEQDSLALGPVLVVPQRAPPPQLTVIEIEKGGTMASHQHPREPTIEERIKIRTMLDKHFDDSTGTYLDGMSDQVIGQSENIPWAIVAKIREAAYGPIRTDPEVVALTRRIEQLTSQLDQLKADFTEWRGRKAAKAA